MSDIPQRLAAALAQRYVLEREIGAGGMATVYLARDLRHKRSVAVKVVRPELGGPAGEERFLREIELAARLQHPHILPVFDSGLVDDGAGAPMPYFVMPYVEGETLRQRLQREGRLPVDVATTLAGEVADALAYAHAHGVVHLSAAPNEETAFPRLQFALALAARPETRAEGIRWLKYGFETLPLFKPLTFLALGHTYEAAGQRDSAAQAYSRFLRLWDKADPVLQGRVREAREALQELSREEPTR